MRSASVGLLVMTAVLGAALPMAASVAHAQVIALAVNGDPVTTLDIDQRMKLLRVLHHPATREAATESMITERLEMREAVHFGIIIKDNEIGEQVTSDAARAKLPPQQFLGEIERGGVSREHFTAYFKARLGFSVLVKILNKGVEASEIAVRAELAKAGGKSAVTDYTLRQVVFTLNPGDSVDVLNARAKEAEALRARFASCASGLDYAKTLQGVAVREGFTRSSSSLSAPLRELLDKTPVGHLTPPSRSASGLEMVAVCNRAAAKDDTELRKTISERLLQAHYDIDAERRLKELRARAVITKHETN